MDDNSHENGQVFRENIFLSALWETELKQVESQLNGRQCEREVHLQVTVIRQGIFAGQARPTFRMVTMPESIVFSFQ